MVIVVLPMKPFDRVSNALNGVPNFAVPDLNDDVVDAILNCPE